MNEKPTLEGVSVPPRNFERNTYGLIADGSVNYVFNEDGTVNWRKMIKTEFLTPNKQYFQRFKKQVPETTEGLEDKELLILLGGIKDLAQIRGFTSVKHDVDSTVIIDNKGNPYHHVISSCSICWIPNYETSNREVTFSAIGDAHPGSTTNFGKIFLGPIAENRAFVRCVRNFLKINIVGQEELSPTSSDGDKENDTLALLREAMTQNGVTFEVLKSKLIAEKVDGAESFESIEDIPNFLKFEFIGRIKRKAAERASSSQ